MELAEANDRVAIRVLPIDAVVAEYRLPYSPFSIYTYPDPGDPLVVVVDTVTTDLVLTEAEEVKPYAELYDAIRASALSASDSLAYLAKAIRTVPRENKNPRRDDHR